jgi:signal transduction histidine kinase
MHIGGKKKNTNRKGVTARQSARTPGDLALLAATPILAPLLILAYMAWQNGGVGTIDPILYILAAAPVFAGIFLFARARKNLYQIACVAEAVSLAVDSETSVTELIVVESDNGPGKAWNTLVHSKFLASSEQAASPLIASPQAGSDLALIALESHSDAIAVVNRAGKVVLANSAADTLYAEPNTILLEKQLGDYLDDGSKASLEDVLKERVQRRLSVDVSRDHDGKQSDEILRFSVAPIRGSSVAFASIVVQDVTRQRHAERSRHDFLAQATHELRTPLTNIRLYVDEAIEAGDEDSKSRAEALNVISSESLRLERIVSELLDISELEAGARNMDHGDVRMDQLLDDLNADFEAMASSSGVTLSFELPPKIPVIHGDRIKIAATLHNLVGNAIKYTPSGGSVVVRAEDEDSILRIAVEDTGIGITEEEQEHVYEKFFRSDDTRVSDIEGTGLGLAFARQVAEMHGGEITLDSELDKGSTFTLSIPKPRMAA